VLTNGAEVIDPERSIMIGRPAHGVAWWGTPTDPEILRLAPTVHPVGADTVRALAAPAIVIPVADESRFLRQYYPGLVRRADVIALDEAAALPGIEPATLTVTAQPLAGHRMSVTWEWVSTIGAETHREPLHDGLGRDDDRAVTLRRATQAVAEPAYGLTEPFPGGRRLLSHPVVAGDVMLRLVREVFPRLAEMDGLDVILGVEDDAPEYVEEDAAPVISFAGPAGGGAGQADWFDLDVRVTVGDEEVGFDGLFLALAAATSGSTRPSSSSCGS
jgi:hypothetical protein